MQEPVEVRLARIEEGIVGLHGKVDAFIKQSSRNSTDVIILKRDRWWTFTICAFLFTSMVTLGAVVIDHMWTGREQGFTFGTKR